ncbi:V-type ATPase, D subunit [Nautilia profundicola AmH]|uniref:V-type ATPase, D subunit n=1 Tax=Nautilia profundicola (strain ATCC BAA-1463 / DSM 18972 / AmH) TaxID=598659 RepID=B9L758_NAUPA|nr:V-type ATP synthase subunit D [Nautilia profundicola]ACM93463.1 V-type ATPase, D subunit [Nautilia profundicola AmH]
MIKNKSTLLELKKDLEIVNEGEEILSKKRDLLLKEIMQIVDIVDKRRKELNETVKSSYNTLIKALMENQNLSTESFVQTELKVVPKSFLGIVIPKINFKIIQKPQIELNTNIFEDLARESFFKSLKMILELAELEIKIWKLSTELKQTLIRVNALKYHYIPTYEKEIKEIKTYLEESEREFIAIIKKLK